MKPIILALAFITSASPVLALSCLRPDAVRLYEQARDSEDAFYIVRGRIDVTGPISEPDPTKGTPGHTQARFTGELLASQDFGAEFDRDINIISTCAGPWCGNPAGMEGDLIAAIRVDDAELSLASGPCGGDMVAWSDDAAARLLACHREGLCEIANDY